MVRTFALLQGKFAAIILVSLLVPLATPTSSGFAPYTNVRLANEVLDSIEEVEEDGQIQYVIHIKDDEYVLNATVADALVNHSAHYRGGAALAASYPDFEFGSRMLFADLGGRAATHEWMRHLWEAAWADDSDNQPAILAFTYGYFLHITSEMWAAEGLRHDDSLTDPVDWLTVNAYVDHHAPSTGAPDLAIPRSFLRGLFIGGSFTDSTGRTAPDIGGLGMYGHFKDLRGILDSFLEQADVWIELNDSFPACDHPQVSDFCEALDTAIQDSPDEIRADPTNVDPDDFDGSTRDSYPVLDVADYIYENYTKFMVELLAAYYEDWRGAVHNGLVEWDKIGRDAGIAMASAPGGHPFEVYADFTTGSGYDASFPEMLGYFEPTFPPEPPSGFWEKVTDKFPGVDEQGVEQALYHLFAQVIDAEIQGGTPLKGMVASDSPPSAADVLYLQQIGVPNEALARHVLSDPGNYALESGKMIDDETLTEFLDRRMGTDGASTWTNGSFDAARNGLRFAQLSLLEPRELNYFLCLHNVGPLYPADGGLKDCMPEPTFLTCPIVVTPGSAGGLSDGTDQSSDCPGWEEYDPNENLPPFVLDDGIDPEGGHRIVPNIWIATQGSGARADLASHHQVGQELLVATSVAYRPGQGPMLLNLTDPDGVVFGEWSSLVTIPGSEVVVLPAFETAALDQAGEWTLTATFANGTAVHKFAVDDPYEHPVPVPRNFALDFIGQTDRGSAWRMASNEGAAHGVWADCPARGRAWTDTFAVSTPTSDSALELPERAVPMSQTPPPKAWAQLSNGTGLMKYDRFVVGPEAVLNLSVHWNDERYWGENDYELTHFQTIDGVGPTSGSLGTSPRPGDQALTFDAPGNHTVKFNAGGFCSAFPGDSRTSGNEHQLEFHADPALGPYPGETTICPFLICGSVALDSDDIERAILAGERLRGLFGVVEPFIPEKPRDGGPPPGPDPAPWMDKLPVGIRTVVGNEIQKPTVQEAFAFGGRSLTRLGVTLDQAGRPDAADVSYRLAGFVGQTDPRTQISLSHAHIQRGDLSQADVYADQALLLAENEAAPHLTKGSVHLAREDGREAETSFRIAMAREPTRPDAMVGLGKALQVQDRPQEAVELYSAALSSLSEGSESYAVVQALRDQAAAEALETTPAPGAPFVFVLVALGILWRNRSPGRNTD